ncbi:hypothetical protein [Pseudomonas fluorescens]|nr:hypothetical protein [Pseudomonas fluorescens]NNB71094.1 hypothetical protein [Pseudomonas fluorescens]
MREQLARDTPAAMAAGQSMAMAMVMAMAMAMAMGASLAKRASRRE